MNEYIYHINSYNDITSDPQFIDCEETRSLLTFGLTINVNYIISSINIKTNENYSGIISGNREYLWKNMNGDPVLKIELEKIESLRSNILNLLRINCENTIKNIEQSEDKAKTESLAWLINYIQWITDGQQGDPPVVPTYWTNWKNSRDTINTNYNTKKSFIHSGDRTYSEIKNYDVSL